jgi:hypothetical protein
MMETKHYLHSMPAVVRLCFAVYFDNRLTGGVVFTQGGRHAHHLLQGASPGQVVTLARLWLADELPANSESRVLGIVTRKLIADGRYKLALSYADPAAGHVGTIYQAAGWLYVGTTQAERYFELDGVCIHPRTASDRFGTNSIAHLRRTGLAIVATKSPAKHRYAYVLDKRWRWRLSRQAQSYPKRGGRSPPARPSPGPERKKRPVQSRRSAQAQQKIGDLSMSTPTRSLLACQRMSGGEF